MLLMNARFVARLAIFFAIRAAQATKPVPQPDPCASISGRRWVQPSEARACLGAAPLDPLVKANIIEVVNKTLAFHTSTNYQIHAPIPFDKDVKEDLVADLERISKQKYDSEFDFHLDIYYSFKNVNDGHCGVYNYCYDSLYVTYLPLPLVLLTADDGSQSVHIAPEAFSVTSKEFEDEIEFWQNALPGHLKGKLASLSGAKVFLINDKEPFVAVNESTETAGSYQSFATRQNSFFSSYHRGAAGWEYNMGNFATKAHPLVDSVKLTVQRVNSSVNDSFTIPYLSRFGSNSKNFTDLASFRANNCVATNATNGVDLYHPSASVQAYEETPPAIAYFQQQPPVNPVEYRKQPMNVLLDGLPLTDIDLPEHLQPSMHALNQSYSVAQFYMLKDNSTGVLALGSFSAGNFTLFGESLLSGLLGLKAAGAKNLIVDVTNNGGGKNVLLSPPLKELTKSVYRVYLHCTLASSYSKTRSSTSLRAANTWKIIGPKESTEPQAGLDSSTRAGPLAQLIVQKIASGGDPDELLSYNPVQWTNASHHAFPSLTNWMKPTIDTVINGKHDSFSQRYGLLLALFHGTSLIVTQYFALRRLGQECQPFSWEAPDYALFEPEDVLIISNGRCASSCSLFSITMSKSEGVRTAVLGGKHGVPQEYCGTVGGQSTDFSMVDTEVKSTKLKNHTLAPPDFLSNSVQGITWRLGYGIDDPEQPEEWQPHPADINIPLTLETVNNPVAIWESIASKEFRKQKLFQVQIDY
ncbi:hypothetical protein D9613_000757 [Agrocybe pediades]|uniref:Tail specific protease domain-containing protein n=1 Tax=Agrocybe pediades TaxID=84607 RepID=A0A8H4R311_9AGAR|nr:hypothetical protein D9613_000757 [Agrocybe pediades]